MSTQPRGRRTIWFFLALLFLEPCSAAPPSAQDRFVLNTPAEPPYHFADQTGILDRWMQEAFSRIGATVVLQLLPPERALINADRGIEDGDVGRIGGLSQKYPNLIQVQETLHVGEFSAFAKGEGFRIQGWESLEPYHVGIIKGHKICEANVGAARSVTAVENLELLFTLLEKGRADVVIAEKRFGEEHVRTRRLEGVAALDPPLATVEFFLYLHKKHAGIVPGLASAVKGMKEDGTHQRIFDEVLGRKGD